VSETAAAAGAALWFGVLTSISPCLLATNVAAISFIARRADKPGYVVVSGGFYIVGQCIAFVALAAVLTESLLTVPTVSHWLQKYMFRLLGPILVLCAMVLLELFQPKLETGRFKQWGQEKTSSGGYWAAALLGIVFAMSFCPTTAALFFGSLLPLAITNESSVFLPFMYAIGVACPVLIFSLVIALAANRVGAFFAKVNQLEKWARQTTGAIFLIVGIWFTLAYTIELF
jgi:cytochrome c biogenesis protein CcdA